MGTLNKLTELFGRFPGIGPRQAKRFVYFLLATPAGFREELARLLLELKSIVSQCAECYRFFSPYKAEKVCALCADSNRDHSTLMIVEKDVDLENVERSRAWGGTYFVLGGTLPILEKKPAERIRVAELQKRLEARAKKGFQELVLALSLTTEGEHTAAYLMENLEPLAQKYNFKITMLGRGLSTGIELEYSDSETIKNALKNRQ